MKVKKLAMITKGMTLVKLIGTVIYKVENMKIKAVNMKRTRKKKINVYLK